MSPGLETPVDLKLKLIPMLQHMHHDASLASSSRELLQQLVNSYPSTPMVIVTLHTFTQLAASSLIDIPKQVWQKKARHWDYASAQRQSLAVWAVATPLARCRSINLALTYVFWKTATERFSPDVAIWSWLPRSVCYMWYVHVAPWTPLCILSCQMRFDAVPSRGLHSS